MASNQRPTYTFSSNAQEKTQEDFEFKDESLNRKCLTSSLTFLCTNLTIDEVVIHLQENEFLTPHEADLIRAKDKQLEKNQMLVNLVHKRGPEAFSCFMKSLTETGQKYLFNKLIEERKIIANRENQSTSTTWSSTRSSSTMRSTSMEVFATQMVNLESLIPEELEQLKSIRVKEIPEQIGQISKGAYEKVSLFKFEDGSLCAGKKPKIRLGNKSPEEERKVKKHLSAALGEIKLLNQLDHERVIKFYGFYLDQRQMIIFMEAMKGSVKAEINEKGYLSETEAMNYFIQAAEGLVYLHSRSPAIVHRDIKCENLLLTMECNVKLADFGKVNMKRTRSAFQKRKKIPSQTEMKQSKARQKPTISLVMPITKDMASTGHMMMLQNGTEKMQNKGMHEDKVT
uniref:Uncharacterized protein n=1 Tax=Plectus sambesii TaxID=2011161 RepID=A0A914WAX8_9BILA